MENTQENLVKKTCRELGITQKELAKELGLTDRTLSKYANEKIPLHIERHLLLMIKDKNKTDSIYHLKSSINFIHNLLNNEDNSINIKK